MKNLINRVLKWFASKVKSAELDAHIAEVKKMQAEYEELLKKNPPVYTTIKTFKGNDNEFWNWCKILSSCDEYRFLLFSIRENCIREIVSCGDAVRLPELNGRLQMIQIIDTYIEKGVAEYEDKLQRDKANPQG
jgi:hypothetical protein